jgi:hypothetical protein
VETKLAEKSLAIVQFFLRNFINTTSRTTHEKSSSCTIAD